MDELQVRLAAPLQPDSIVDGEGIRTVIWFQGCSHDCPGCHNPSSHDFNGGFLANVQDIAEEIAKLEFQDGITFSGGDPLFQPEALLALLKATHNNKLNAWVYTGFTYEQLLKMAEEKPIYREVLENIDILVDGRFVLALKSFEVMFRGSSNQRIIDVPKSLAQGKVVLVEKYV